MKEWGGLIDEGTCSGREDVFRFFYFHTLLWYIHVLVPVTGYIHSSIPQPRVWYGRPGELARQSGTGAAHEPHRNGKAYWPGYWRLTGNRTRDRVSFLECTSALRERLYILPRTHRNFGNRMGGSQNLQKQSGRVLKLHRMPYLQPGILSREYLCTRQQHGRLMELIGPSGTRSSRSRGTAR